MISSIWFVLVLTSPMSANVLSCELIDPPLVSSFITILAVRVYTGIFICTYTNARLTQTMTESNISGQCRSVAAITSTSRIFPGSELIS